eukprot:gene10984-biopygen2286
MPQDNIRAPIEDVAAQEQNPTWLRAKSNAADQYGGNGCWQQRQPLSSYLPSAVSTTLITLVEGTTDIAVADELMPYQRLLYKRVAAHKGVSTRSTTEVWAKVP